MAKKPMYTADEIIERLLNDPHQKIMETQLLKPKLIRSLYKQLGDPSKEDFPDIKWIGTYDKFPGYTTDMYEITETKMDIENNAPTRWNIQRPSLTKINIVNTYTKEGWHCTVGAYNVTCNKYVKHPRYKNICVRFYCTRDVNRYEYMLITGE